MKSAQIVVVGSANLDLVVRVARPPAVGETLLGHAAGQYPGGKGLNQAVSASRVGGNVSLCAVVGTDEAGDTLQRAATDAGVGQKLYRDADAPTGLAHIFSYPDGDNSIVVAAGANAALTPKHAREAVTSASVVLAVLEVPVSSVRAAFAAAPEGALRILNAAPAHDDTHTLLPDTDILIVNESECEALGGVEALLDNVDTVVLTLGARGVQIHRNGQAFVHVPAHRVHAVDTTGAGDAFCGAFAVALADNADVADAVRQANAAGAIVASHHGATTEALTPQAIAELLSRT